VELSAACRKQLFSIARPSRLLKSTPGWVVVPPSRLRRLPSVEERRTLIHIWDATPPAIWRCFTGLRVGTRRIAQRSQQHQEGPGRPPGAGWCGRATRAPTALSGLRTKPQGHPRPGGSDTRGARDHATVQARAGRGDAAGALRRPPAPRRISACSRTSGSAPSSRCCRAASRSLFRPTMSGKSSGSTIFAAGAEQGPAKGEGPGRISKSRQGPLVRNLSRLSHTRVAARRWWEA
jgi:hypothetical protein